MSKIYRVIVQTMVLFTTALASQSTLLAQANGGTEQPASESHDTQPPTLQLAASVVMLDVVVTDKKGNLVQRELTRDGFEVLEDGQPQQIRSFEPPNLHRMPLINGAIVNSAADLKKIGDAPVMILVLDELNSRFEDMSYSRQMLIKYLQSQPKVLKQPTALMVAMNTSFQQMHDYTQDRDALLQTVNKHIPEYPWHMMNSGKGGPGAVERMAQVLAALQQIAEAWTGTRGHKNLIWIGDGFPTVDLVSLDSTSTATIETAIRRCTSRLLAARVTMYIINPSPGSSSTIDVETPDDLDSALDENGSDPFNGGSVTFPNFAPSTGGISFMGRNDLNHVIGESVDKGQEYYTITYSPTDLSAHDAKFRKIKIVMKDPNLRATTRDGYFPEMAGDLNPVTDKSISAKQLQATLVLDLSSALTSKVAYNGLSISVARVADGQYAIQVADDGLAWSGVDQVSSQHAEATVGAGWYDSRGRLLGHVFREETFPHGDIGAGATFTLPVALPADAIRLRFLVRDAFNGHMGTVDVTTPR
jgi:VWFA-related protein